MESALSRRLFRGKVQYLMKWQGYAEPTWEQEKFLKDEAGHHMHSPTSRTSRALNNGLSFEGGNSATVQLVMVFQVTAYNCHSDTSFVWSDDSLQLFSCVLDLRVLFSL